MLVFGLGMDVAKMLDRTRNGSETVVVIDTLRGLGILPEEENDNGAVARALEPWLSLCRQGEKTLIGLHHDRKTGGRHGQGVSGRTPWSALWTCCCRFVTEVQTTAGSYQRWVG